MHTSCEGHRRVFQCPMRKKYFAYPWNWGTHLECAQEICPMYNASLACVPDLKSNQEIQDMLWRTDQDDVWIGIYSDPEKPFGDGSQDATLNSWTSGCSSSFRGENPEATDPTRPGSHPTQECGPGCYR